MYQVCYFKFSRALQVKVRRALSSRPLLIHFHFQQLQSRIMALVQESLCYNQSPFSTRAVSQLNLKQRVILKVVNIVHLELTRLNGLEIKLEKLQCAFHKKWQVTPYLSALEIWTSSLFQVVMSLISFQFDLVISSCCSRMKSRVQLENVNYQVQINRKWYTQELFVHTFQQTPPGNIGMMEQCSRDAYCTINILGIGITAIHCVTLMINHSTFSPRITWFPQTNFPLRQFLVYVYQLADFFIDGVTKPVPLKGGCQNLLNPLGIII